ncbi:DNA adenine methylase [Clostridium sp. MT-14]|uniref:DNA adenine methylase n=1 Tax=Clostridium sp. MT-14 TaxID=3348360 RepID=UPI0035F26963
MQYVGSKNRISKEVAPIIQSYITKNTKGYLEPFTGGANMIDKIQCANKIGCDIHEELIELLKYAQHNELPETVSEDTYKKVKNNKDKYEKWYVGLVGFCASFGAKYFGGYARRYNKDGVLFDVPRQAINSLRKQSKTIEFKNTKFIHSNFLDLPIDKINNYVIYCDPPYKNATKYKTKDFPYEKFYQWVKKISIHNVVLISEYNMPEEFTCIWKKKLKTSLGSGVNKDSNKIRVEKLFTYKV